MKPVRLEAEGFTCYRERQQPLDFSGLSLFAIAGPTGAGKSSILDTMLYALYGEVPRIGKQGVSEFISHGRDAMWVSLDFAVRGSVYRVVRRVKRGKKNLSTSATLAELLPSGERSVADGVKPVNEAVTRLLGLDFSAFTQTVILPQGDFDKFLKAPPNDQRAILQRLLRHEVFERMRAEAERRRGEDDREVRALDGQLGTFEHATPAALAAKQQELASAQAVLGELAVQKRAQEAAVQEQRLRHQLTLEVRTLRSRRGTLDAASPAVAAMRDELTAAGRAAQLVPRIEACASAQARVAAAIRERTAAEGAASSRTAAVEAAEQQVALATADAEPCAGLARQLRALDEITGDLSRREVLKKELDGYTRSQPAARTRSAAAWAKADQAIAGRNAAAAALDAARAALADAGFDAAEERQLDELWTTVVQVRAADEELARLDAARQRLAVDLQRAERLAATEDTALALARDAAAAAVEAEREATAALELGQTRFQAAAVREHLHPGEACPVCLQTVVLMPPQQSVSELDALGAAREQARVSLSAAQRALQAAGEKRAAAAAGVDSARRGLDAGTAAFDHTATGRSALVARIVGALAGTAAAASADDVCTVVEGRRQTVRAAKVAHDRAAESVRLAERATASAELARVTADAERTAATEELERLERDAASRRVERDEVVARIAAVSSSGDPAAERAALAQRLASLEAALRAAQQALAEVRTGAAAAVARYLSATVAASQAEAAVATEGAALSAALRESGFPDVAAASAAVRPASRQTTLDAAVRQHESDRAAVLNRLLEIEPRIVNGEVSDEAMAAANTECTRTVNAWHDAGLAVSTLRADCERLAKDVAAREAIEQGAAAMRARLALHTAMASDLRGDAFQEYLLEEAFHSLVSGASVRMRQMSNRYTLEWDNGDFFVVDHDNAGERRRAETLSGGETFMASLCLALQLSEEVLKTSGALQMDSLFIDEGFGTLDAESLAEVTDAMEALREDGARLIGVISHRPELTERLPGCIRVVKGAGESTWRLERQG